MSGHCNLLDLERGNLAVGLVPVSRSLIRDNSLAGDLDIYQEQPECHHHGVWIYFSASSRVSRAQIREDISGGFCFGHLLDAPGDDGGVWSSKKPGPHLDSFVC